MTGPAGKADGSWIVEWPSRLTPMVDLLCFAGAGAGASVYRPLAARLPGFAAVAACQLPARENRIGEAPAASLSSVADAAASAFCASRDPGRPLVLFGHSMGGALAFEVAMRLAAASRPPCAVVMSASAPPDGARAGREIACGELRELLLAYDSENRAILSDDELFASLAPALRGDIGLLREHVVDPGARLNAAAELLTGQDDRVVSRAAAAGWVRHFTGPVTQAVCAGGHHFPFRESAEAVIERLSGHLRQALRQRAPA